MRPGNEAEHDCVAETRGPGNEAEHDCVAETRGPGNEAEKDNVAHYKVHKQIFLSSRFKIFW